MSKKHNILFNHKDDTGMGRSWLITPFTLIAMLFWLLQSTLLQAAVLKDIQVNNSQDEARISLQFKGRPTYAFFSLKKPDRVVLDVQQSRQMPGGLPLRFNQTNLIKEIRSSNPKESDSIRLVIDLQRSVETRAVTQQHQNNYTVILTIKAHAPATPPRQTVTRKSDPGKTAAGARSGQSRSTPGHSLQNRASRSPSQQDNPPSVINTPPYSAGGNRIVVAIDAGHGGQDPGAIGPGGLQEKKVTLAIARKLYALLEQDPLFTAVMTRNGDYFISVMGRSDVARSKKANILISVHADAAPNRNATGASVWVLSNRRADSELGRWLEQHEKQSELLGGAGYLLASREMDPYLSKAVLDLQFGHSQRVGYDVAKQVLRQLNSVSRLHKRWPEHASLGVLRSPDIPSLLVETGFISSRSEEKLLGDPMHQDKIARAIYQGVRNYFKLNPIQSEVKSGKVERVQSTGKSRPVPTTGQSASSNRRSSSTEKSTNHPVRRHTVKRGDTLSGIAVQYGVSMTELKRVNHLKADTAILGQRLIIP